MISERATLDAQAALIALRCLALDPRPDLAVIDGAWLADCRCCRFPRSLRVRELSERTGDNRDPPVAVGCVRRCADPAVIAAILATDPDLLEARDEAARWQALATWAIDSYRRSTAGSTHDHADPSMQVAA